MHTVPSKMILNILKIISNLGLITKEYSNTMKQEVVEKWCEIAFHNKEINLVERARELEFASPTNKYNAASKIYNRIAMFLYENNKLRMGQGSYIAQTDNQNDLEEWVARLQGIDIIQWIPEKYDVTISHIKLQKIDGYKKIWVVFKTKGDDEGFEGGTSTMHYEKERLREEWRIRKIRKLKSRQKIEF